MAGQTQTTSVAPLDLSQFGGQVVTPPAASQPLDLSQFGGTVAQVAPPSAPTSTDQDTSADTPGFGNRFSEVTTGTQHPVAQAQSEIQMLKDHPADTLVQVAKSAAMAPVNFAYNLLHHPVDTITGLTGGPQFSEDLANQNYSGMAGDFAGGLANALLIAGKPVTEYVPRIAAASEEAAKIAGTVKPNLPDARIPNPEPKIISWAKQKVGRELTPAETDATPAAGRIQPALNNTPAEVIKHAEQEGIDLTPAQVTGSRIAQNVQAAGERSILGGEDLRQAIGKSRIAMLDSVDSMLRRVDPEMKGTSPEEAGEHIVQDVADKKEAAHEQAKNVYKSMDEFTQLPVDVSDVQDKWMKMRDDMNTVLANAPSETANKLRQVFNLGSELGTPGATAESKASPVLPFKDAMQLRSFFREMGQTHMADLPSRYQGLFKQLSSDVDGAMEKSADGAGLTDLWRQANGGWKDYIAKYGDDASPLHRILAQDPTRAASDIISRKSASDIEALKSENVDLAPIKQLVLTDILKKGFRVNTQGLGGYPHGFLRTLLGPEDTKSLYLKGDIARRLGFEVNPSGTSNVEVTLDQLVGPKKLLASVGGAKSSMPRNPSEMLPRGNGTVGAKPISKVAGVPVSTKAITRAGQAGRAAALSNQNTNQEASTFSPERTYFRASDGSLHSINDDAASWDAVKKVDPQAQIVRQP